MAIKLCSTPFIILQNHLTSKLICIKSSKFMIYLFIRAALPHKAITRMVKKKKKKEKESKKEKQIKD